MSIRNAYRQGYNAAQIGDSENLYKRMNKARDAYAWDRGFNDFKNGVVYQPPFSDDEFENVRVEHSKVNKRLIYGNKTNPSQ